MIRLFKKSTLKNINFHRTLFCNVLPNVKLIHLYLMMALVLTIYSCKKEDSQIGLSLQSQNEIIGGNKIDTITVKAVTCREDSLSSDERTYQLLGSYLDPIFGYAEASFMSQIRLSSSNASFGTSPIADSAYVYLDYSSFYGDTTVSQTLNVYELEKSIYLDSVYYSNLNPDLYIPSNKCIGTLTYQPRPSDTCLSIKLSDSFAQQLISATSTDLQNDDNFLQFFKGFYFKTQPILGQSAIIYFNLLSTRSKMTLFYHTATDTLKFDFLFNSKCARINLFHHDYSTSQIQLNDTTSTDSLLYLQAMAGLNVKITFPYITQLAKEGLLALVNAELIIPIETNDISSSLYKSPSSLLLVAYNSSGAYEFMPDYTVNTTYFGGNKNSAGTEYRFNISRYIQQLAYQQRQDYGIALIINSNRVSANRVIIKSPHGTNGLRLSITYLKP